MVDFARPDLPVARRRKHLLYGGVGLAVLADEPTGNLDSKNGALVMDLLQGPHASGSTICTVTHDPRYAHRATHTIHLFDGRVVAGDDDAQM